MVPWQNPRLYQRQCLGFAKIVTDSRQCTISCNECHGCSRRQSTTKVHMIVLEYFFCALNERGSKIDDYRQSNASVKRRTGSYLYLYIVHTFIVKRRNQNLHRIPVNRSKYHAHLDFMQDLCHSSESRTNLDTLIAASTLDFPGESVSLLNGPHRLLLPPPPFPFSIGNSSNKFAHAAYTTQCFHTSSTQE